MLNFSEELIWKTIGGKEFCSFKWVTPKQNFCKNDLNLTGFCSKQFCPLSNSKYATVVEKGGSFLLYQKDDRYGNLPDMLWKKTLLSRNYIKAIQQLDLKLAFWPKFFVHRIKQKLTKLTQKIIRNRITNIKSEKIYKKKTTIFFKTTSSEIKTQSKIKIEAIIQNELINRLNMGVYGDLYPHSPIQKWKEMEKKRAYKLLKGKFPQETFIV
mmetsp:Transcript_12320/g.25343  ORF Transcript_12320/g.25343 Transcript_12320/m.25343 type:complete len:212 (+) Transcript_12320:1364-1999(+)